MTRKPQTRKPKAAPQTETINNTGATALSHPVFGQPQRTDDPTKFKVKHPSDDPAYKRIDELNREHKLAPLPFPAPRGLPEPRLTLAAVPLGTSDASLQRQIKANGQIVFHATGDTGSTRGPESQNRVADKMVDDFTDEEKGREREAALFVSPVGATLFYSFPARQNIITTSFMSRIGTIPRRFWQSPATTTEWSHQARMPRPWRHFLR